MESMRQRKIVLIVVGSCLLLLFLGLAALNAFRLTFLSPSTPGEIFLFTSISLIAFLLFVTALVLLMRNMLKLYAEQRNRVLGARLRSRMLWGAVLLSLLPIGCMYFFSYMLMNRAVDRWFSQPAAQLRDQSSSIATDLSRYVVANARSEAEELPPSSSTAKERCCRRSKSNGRCSSTTSPCRADSFSSSAILQWSRGITPRRTRLLF